MIEYISDQSGFPELDQLKDLKLTSIDLSRLQLPSSELLLQSTSKIVEKIGPLESWRSKNTDRPYYSGFSITHNPDFIDQKRSHYFQTLGAYQLPQSFSRTVSEANFSQIKNSYYDSYGYRSIDPMISNEYDSLLKKMRFPLVRSRVVYFYSHEKSLPEHITYHKDEFPFQVLRLVIPLVTDSSYKLEINGADEYKNSENLITHLEPNKAYVWNTRIPHRVFCDKLHQIPKCRIHLILGFAPWYNLCKDESGAEYFEPNEYFGIPIKKIIDDLIFIKKT